MFDIKQLGLLGALKLTILTYLQIAILTQGRSESILSFEKVHFKTGDGLGLTCNSNPFRHLKLYQLSINTYLKRKIQKHCYLFNFFESLRYFFIIYTTSLTLLEAALIFLSSSSPSLRLKVKKSLSKQNIILWLQNFLSSTTQKFFRCTQKMCCHISIFMRVLLLLPTFYLNIIKMWRK